MKKDKFLEVITFLGILTSLGILLVAGTSCSMKFYKESPADVRKCCERLSLHDQEMRKFNRYCKVALFMHRSPALNDPKIKENVKTAVDICKFVFMTDDEEQLVSTVEQNDKVEPYKVRQYIISPEDGFWRQTLPCDPDQFACEEF